MILVVYIITPDYLSVYLFKKVHFLTHTHTHVWKKAKDSNVSEPFMGKRPHPYLRGAAWPTLYFK